VDDYLTADEVAMMLKLSVQTIRRYTMNKEIPHHKLNRAVRYKKSEIELWLEKREGRIFSDVANLVCSNSVCSTSNSVDGDLFSPEKEEV